MGIVRVAGEDIPAGDRAAADAEATSRLKSSVRVAQAIFARRLCRAEFVWEKSVSVKIVAAINSMNKQGHHTRIFRHQGKMWVEIDQCMLASFSEIEELVDGVHSFEELGDLFKGRHAKELGSA
jgi:hypothetical protein